MLWIEVALIVCGHGLLQTQKREITIVVSEPGSSSDTIKRKQPRRVGTRSNF
ncbi:hypothetical protein [Cytobacillus sp. AMY 15.2]|uniref:hypothetical protein n=1 Tax=Cytobacillus sp. AMY 15.2 TaxID=2939563 RepID=UPI00203EE57E|nr:hypothetical protein [Cytobacillus sp. AMY 15.2]